MYQTMDPTDRLAAAQGIVREQSLERFAAFCRRDVIDLAERSDRFADLADSFPALLFALATRFGSVANRERCTSLVLEAKPLKQAASALGLPMWLRRLPPEAFIKPLSSVPTSADFARRITALVPEHPETGAETAAWLQRVLLAAEACHEEFAIWMARHRRGPVNVRSEERLCLLAAWAWHADRPGTLGHRMLRSAWTPQISLKRALDESRVWERRIELAVMLRSAPRIAWLDGAVVNGYEFVPLDTVEEFLAESAAMNNCLDQYGEQLALGMNRVYSIRLNGKRIADIEIGGHNDDATVPAIVQLRGPRNHRVGPHIWRAAYAWMASQPANIVKSPSRTLARKARDDLREQLWAPYLDALGTTPFTERIRAFIVNREAAARRLANFAAEMVSCARTR